MILRFSGGFADWLVEEAIPTTLDGEQLALGDVSPDALFTNEFVG